MLNENSSSWRFDQPEYSLKQNGVDAEHSVPILNCSSCFMKYGDMSDPKLNFKNKTILWTVKN